MGLDVFVHNVKELCKIKGVAPTVALESAGVGKNFLYHIEARGSEPSIAKVQQLANYFGVTTSQLLGEVYIKHSTGRVLMEGGASEPKPASPGEDGILSLEEVRLILGYRAADPALQEMVRRVLAVD